MQESTYSGMTLNERLFTAGLLEQFDDAARNADRARMLGLLLKVGLSEPEAQRSVDAILSSPARYGL